MEAFDLNLILFPLTMVLFFIVVFLSLYLVVKLIQGKGRVVRALNMSLFLVSVPKLAADDKAKKPFKELVAVMEQFYASLSNLKEKGWSAFLYGQPVFAFEMAVQNVGEEICFYVACPRRLQNVMEKQIHGFFPTADVRPAQDYNIFNPQGVSLASYIFPNRGISLPIRTYQGLDADPLNEIVNALSKLDTTGEGAAIQLIIKPLTAKRWRKMALRIAREMQKGRHYDLATLQVDRNWFVRLTDILSGTGPASSQVLFTPQKPATPLGPPSVTPLNTEIIKALEAKANKVAYEANINLIVSAKMPEQAEALLLQLESSFAQFNTANLNSLKTSRLRAGRALKNLLYNFSFRIFDNSRPIVLSTEELASIFHFPTTEVDTPKVKFIRSKQAAPPPNMPSDGLILGKNTFRGVETVVRLQRNDRRRHLYIVGQTGTGKTSAMQGMLAQDVVTEGLGVIDPHGEFADYVLGCVPKERAEDVVYFNPADLERPMGLNMLEYDPKYPEQKTFIVNELISIFDKLYDLKTTGGPIFEQYTRNALQLLMDDPAEGATLMDVPRVLADAAYRKRLLAKCQNIVVKDFWEKEAEKAGGEAALVNIVPYITSKFNTFIANDFMRPIIGQSQSAFNFREIMDGKKILIVNLSKGRLGDLNAYLLGLIIVGKLMMAAFSRVDTPEEERPDFYLYLDEFQNFTTDSISTILSEARKYKLCLTVAHQYVKQVPEKIRDAVFGNIGSMLVMRVGAEDAEVLVKQFAPVFDQNDLINLDNFNACAKLLINNLTSKPFNVVFDRPPKESREIIEALKELSRLKYGHDRTLVEQTIASHYKT